MKSVVSRFRQVLESTTVSSNKYVSPLLHMLESAIFESSSVSDIESSKIEYDKIKQYFSGKVDFNKIDEAWSKLFHEDFFKLTGMTVEQFNNRRKDHIAKYVNREAANATTLAKSIIKNYPMLNVSEDDAIQEAVTALTEGMNRLYCSPTIWKTRRDPKKDLKGPRVGPMFLRGGNNPYHNSSDGFLAKVVKSAVYDLLRKDDVLSPTSRKTVNKIKQAVKEFESKEGRQPNASEIAKATGLTEPTVKQYLNLLSLQRSSFEDDLVEYSGDFSKKVKGGSAHLGRYYLDNPELRTLLIDELDRASKVIAKRTSGRERLVLELYVYEELSSYEVMEVLGINKEDYDKLFLSAVEKIKYELKEINWDGIGDESK